MAITQISKIQARTGGYSDLPVLASGELGWATDQQRLFIGNPGSTLPNQNTEIYTYANPPPIPLLTTRIATGTTDTVLNSDDVVAYSNTAAVAVTLPSPYAGRVYYLKDIAGAARVGNPITITVADAGSGENIDGSTSVQINSAWGALQFIGLDSTVWILV